MQILSEVEKTIQGLFKNFKVTLFRNPAKKRSKKNISKKQWQKNENVWREVLLMKLKVKMKANILVRRCEGLALL